MIKLDEIEAMSPKDIAGFYTKYVNVGIPKILNMLGFDRIEPDYSEGIFIYTKGGEKIYDFTGGNSVLNIGHNHPRILQARRDFNEQKKMEVWKLFLSPYMAALSKNLAELLPGDLNYSFFCNSGAEANEGALKIAEKYQGADKNIIVYTDISYHGRTHATMSISGSEHTRSNFKLLDGCVSLPYGDADEFEAFIRGRCGREGKKNDIIAIILEAVVASYIVVPPKGYLKRVRDLCDEYGILMIVDDVFCGFGRTGAMFSFQHEDVVPDIITVSKTLGGGKASIAAYVARDHVYRKSYGDLKNYMIHSTTFNGLGEECYTAIEALNVLVEEDLVENSKNMGEYLRASLMPLKERYPNMVSEIKGIGLLNGVLLQNPGEKILKALGNEISFFNDLGEGIFAGVIIALLMSKYKILLSTHPHCANQLVINPSLIVNREQIDYLVNSLDDMFSSGFIGMGKDFSLLKAKHILT